MTLTKYGKIHSSWKKPKVTGYAKATLQEANREVVKTKTYCGKSKKIVVFAGIELRIPMPPPRIRAIVDSSMGHRLKYYFATWALSCIIRQACQWYTDCVV